MVFFVLVVGLLLLSDLVFNICYQRPAIWREQVEPGSRVYLAPQSQSQSQSELLAQDVLYRTSGTKLCQYLCYHTVNLISAFLVQP